MAQHNSEFLFFYAFIVFVCSFSLPPPLFTGRYLHYCIFLISISVSTRSILTPILSIIVSGRLTDSRCGGSAKWHDGGGGQGESPKTSSRSKLEREDLRTECSGATSSHNRKGARIGLVESKDLQGKLG